MDKNSKDLIFNEIKLKKNFNSDKDLATYLGITPQKLYNWRNENNFDIEILYEKTVDLNFNPIYLITGKGSIYISETPVSVVRSACEECKAHKRTIENLNDTIYMYKEKLSICEKRDTSIRTIAQEKTS